MDPTEQFAANRPMLFALAYRMLGSVADTEDVLQDAWLRWSSADRSAVAEPRAYLARTVTRVALTTCGPGGPGGPGTRCMSGRGCPNRW